MNEINVFYNSGSFYNITADIYTTQSQNYKPNLDKVVGHCNGKCIFDRWDETGNHPFSGLDGRQNRLFHAEPTDGRYPSSLRPAHKVSLRSRHTRT